MGLHHPIVKGMIDRNGRTQGRCALITGFPWHSSSILGSLRVPACRQRRCLPQPDWVARVFPERAHDFGIVARGSQVRHAFPVVNRTDMEVRIVDWRTKCGCTNVRVGSKVIPPGTQTTIEATIDTTQFVGYKASGLTLVLDRPLVTEVDLNMNCFIRADITLTPGLVDFGIVRPSDKPATVDPDSELRRRPLELGNRRHEDPDRQGQGDRQGARATATGRSSGT